MEKTKKSKLILSIEMLSFLYTNNLVKAEVLSEKFELSKRSIRRIINDLRMVGYDIESISGPHGGYRLNKGALILPIRLSENDKRLWQQAITTIESSDINDKAETLKLLKLISVISQLENDFVYDIYLTKKLLASKNRQIKNVESILSTALKNKNRVLIKYQGLNHSENITWQEFRPQQFQIFNQIPYIKGYYNSESSSFRTLRLSRFIDIKLSPKKYSFNENFESDNNQSPFSKQIYQTYIVKLKIFKGNHDLLDYEYGANQTMIEYTDYCILEFELAGDQIIKELVLNMGKNAKLIEPKNIVKMLKAEIKSLHNLYSEE